MKLAPSFGLVGSFAQTTVVPASDWLAQLCGWVRRAPGDIGPLAWPVVLMPQRIDPAFTLPDDARIVYQQVAWDGELPAGPIDLNARTAWVSGGQVAVRSSASSSGVTVAQSAVVVRTELALPAWGTRDAPMPPSVVGDVRRLSFALSEHDVAAFAELSGVHEAIHEDAAHAWRLGFANAVVQELMLLLIVMHVARVHSPGQIAMWFLEPVPVGGLLTLWQSGDLWAVRSATGRAAAIARVSGTVGQMADAHLLRQRND